MEETRRTEARAEKTKGLSFDRPFALHRGQGDRCFAPVSPLRHQPMLLCPRRQVRL